MREHGAPLEARNRWGGTVLASTLYFALHPQPNPADYAAAIELLLEAGADLGAVTCPTGNELIDELLRRRGAPGVEPV